MKRNEWLLVLALALVTILSLSFAPPQNAGSRAAAESAQIAAATETVRAAATATARPSPTPTATATPSPSPTSSPTRRPTRTPTRTLTPSPTPYPFDTHPELERYMFVDQDSQYLYIFERGGLLRAIPCSTGLPHSDKYTPGWSGNVGPYVGTFFSFGAYADDAWYLFQSEGGILIHSLPYLLDEDGAKLYQDRQYLGVRPASHGCIRIAPEDILWLNEWNPEGVAITVSDPYLAKWQPLEAEDGGW